MARRRSSGEEEPPQLTVARLYLEEELNDRIGRGERLLEMPVTSTEDLEAVRRDFYTWHDYNVELLRKRFTTSEISESYKSSGGVFVVGGTSTLAGELKELHEDIQDKIQALVSVRERLGLYDEPTIQTAGPPKPESPSATAQTIFIVHGHDDRLKQEVARFLQQVTPLKSVILHDQANQGRTIIEKFEDHAADAAFAVVLITPDDEGRERGAEELRDRARQNVVFELGFFFGKLGRSRVAALFESSTELPSDMSGVLYTEIDERGAWKVELAREMKAAGLDVDLNKVL